MEDKWTLGNLSKKNKKTGLDSRIDVLKKLATDRMMKNTQNGTSEHLVHM
jgi:hypothetical protein